MCVCKDACVCTGVCVQVHMCIYIYTYIQVCAGVCVCTDACVCAQVHIHMKFKGNSFLFYVSPPYFKSEHLTGHEAFQLVRLDSQ